MTRIYVFPADSFGCGHYRLIWPAEELQRRGHDVVIVRPEDREHLIVDIGADGHVVRARCPDDADVLVFQRVTHVHLAEAIAQLVEQRKVRVVMDMDDDLAAIDPANPAFTMLMPRTFGLGPGQSKHSFHVVDWVARHVNLVTVSTPGLAQRYGGHGRVRVIENHVPRRYLEVHHDPHDGPLGWPASMHSHPTDPGPAAHAVSRLTREGVPFVVFGDRRGSGRAFFLDKDAPGPGDVDLPNWARVIATLRVGVVPLADTLFNRSKSWLKGLELASAGVPFVATPTREYVRLNALGMGILAERSRDWYRQVRRLWDDASYRHEASARARFAAAAWTYEEHAGRWAEAWLDALRLEPRPVRASTNGDGRRNAPRARRHTTPPPGGGGAGLIGEIRRVPRST